MEALIQKISGLVQKLDGLPPFRIDGRVADATGVVIEATAKQGTIGDICEIHTGVSGIVKAEIVGFRGNRILLMPLGETLGIAPGNRVEISPLPLKIVAGEALLGRVLDGMGKPIDGKGQIVARDAQPVYASPPNPLLRQRITTPLTTGIKVIDGLLTIAKGQRVGIFAGSGVGKSVLLGMIARYTDADINVIALIGERGREVREFIERDLQAEGLAHSIVVVATSDQPATVRIKGALVATGIAEYFRDKGKNVLLLMDSLTRVSMAQREIGLAIGEPPTTKGYTPSVFALMPRLLERAGNSEKGSITGFYTVLVEGGDLDEPVSDTARSILDGHIVLSRAIASQGHYPAIDVLESISRVKHDVISPEQREWSQKVLELLATYKASEDLINIGAYAAGSNSRIDLAIEHIEAINTFLKQDITEAWHFDDTLKELQQLIEKM